MPRSGGTFSYTSFADKPAATSHLGDDIPPSRRVGVAYIRGDAGCQTCEFASRRCDAACLRRVGRVFKMRCRTSRMRPRLSDMRDRASDMRGFILELAQRIKIATKVVSAFVAFKGRAFRRARELEPRLVKVRR